MNIYIVDGLDPEDGDFRHIGDLIEEDFLPTLKECIEKNEINLGDDILVTEWGILYVCYFPVHNQEGNVIGAIGIEFDCEHLYNSMVSTRSMTVIITLLFMIIFILAAFYI